MPLDSFSAHQAVNVLCELIRIRIAAAAVYVPGIYHHPALIRMILLLGTVIEATMYFDNSAYIWFHCGAIDVPFFHFTVFLRDSKHQVFQHLCALPGRDYGNTERIGGPLY